MTTLTLSIEADLLCTQCGAALDYDEKRNRRSDQIELHIEFCEGCSKVEYDKGFEAGKAEALAEASA